MSKPATLTPKQSAFAGFVAKGLSYTEAYRKAYDTNTTDKAVNTLASRLMKNEKVRKAVEDLKADKKEAKKAHQDLSAKWIIERLKSEAMNEGNPPSTRVRALELLGKSEGVFDESSTVVVEHRNPEDIERELRDRLSGLFVDA
jgi:hypothetical protein